MSSNGWTKTESLTLISLLAECQLVLKTYGKQSDDLDKTVKIFIKYLADFEPEKVMNAFKSHIRTSPEFPTPSDIIKIIENKTHDRDRPNHQIYREICNKKINGEYLTSSESEYKKQYESFYLSNKST